ncbi:hypothetical protein [Jeotgalibacillus campisalis]|uniref:Uncharacterized protein n=1 Tax=Jeotgalibacillus campisalis TaxID=220754 RepID=A0A0C2VWC4_9BACL|nr:hypothetical protein [Jeotgalibacillus campisalis]KIL48711.1 hypothetical protein KR50_12960 [Jeotgalibacillus campisalis]
MELLIQALMESLNEGTIPLAFMLMMIWNWDKPFYMNGWSSKWSDDQVSAPPVKKLISYHFNSVEARCSRMIFGKTIKMKTCPDDSDVVPSFLFQPSIGC